MIEVVGKEVRVALFHLPLWGTHCLPQWWPWWLLMEVNVLLWVVLSGSLSVPLVLQRPEGHRHDCLLGELGCAVFGAQCLWSSRQALLLTDSGETSSPAQACLQTGLMAANGHRTQKGRWWAWRQVDSTLPRESLKVLLSLLLGSALSPTAQGEEEAVRRGEMTGSPSRVPW